MPLGCGLTQRGFAGHKVRAAAPAAISLNIRHAVGTHATERHLLVRQHLPGVAIAAIPRPRARGEGREASS